MTEFVANKFDKIRISPVGSQKSIDGTCFHTTIQICVILIIAHEFHMSTFRYMLRQIFIVYGTYFTIPRLIGYLITGTIHSGKQTKIGFTQTEKFPQKLGALLKSPYLSLSFFLSAWFRSLLADFFEDFLSNGQDPARVFR